MARTRHSVCTLSKALQNQDHPIFHTRLASAYSVSKSANEYFPADSFFLFLKQVLLGRRNCGLRYCKNDKFFTFFDHF